jgi:hypothetical protein
LPSMSRIANSTDNRLIEYFWNILKKHLLIKLKLRDRTLKNVSNEITKFINYYNKSRVQNKLGKKTPVEYGKQYCWNYLYDDIECMIYTPTKCEFDSKFEESMYNYIKSCISI